MKDKKRKNHKKYKPQKDMRTEENEIKKDHLPQQFKDIKEPSGIRREGLMTLAEFEKKYILEVLSATKGNKSEAARILNINRASLWRKLKQFEEDDRT